MADSQASGEGTATERIDALLEALPDDQRAALQSLRETIATAAPDAVEAISYGMPAFRYRGRPLVSYRAFARHCSFYPMSGTLIEDHRDELAAFAAAKGTLRFTPDAPIPRALVQMVVTERMARSTAADRGASTRDGQPAGAKVNVMLSEKLLPSTRSPSVILAVSRYGMTLK